MLTIKLDVVQVHSGWRVFMKCKWIFLAAAMAVSAVSVQAQTVYTGSEYALIQDVLSKRIELRKTSDIGQALSKVDSFLSSVHSGSAYGSASREVKIVVDNFLVYSKYNILYERNDKDAALKDLVVKQYRVVEAYREENKKAVFNPWFYLSSGDIVNSCMQFLSRGEAIKVGLQEKSDYDSLIKSNPRMSCALINAGLWYYFAPGIGGGSKSKAKDYFLKASQNASTSYERYYANIYLSQCLFEGKKSEDCEKYLAMADAAAPGTSYVTFIKKLNASGYSLFDYISNKAKLDAKLK